MDTVIFVSIVILIATVMIIIAIIYSLSVRQRFATVSMNC